MIKSKYFVYVLIIAAVVVSAVSYFKYSSDNRKRIFSDLIKEYSPLTLEDSVSGYVKEIHQPYITEINNHPHQAFVILTPYKKHLIMVGLELRNEQMTLDEILKVGDYVLKKSGSNRISIIRLDTVGDSLEFNFAITDYLGYQIKADSLRN
jgi:hypothetical protein